MDNSPKSFLPARSQTNWMIVGGAALITGVAGFSLAHFMADKKAPTAEAPVKTELTLPDAYLTQANIGVEDVAQGNLAAEIGAAGTVVAAPGGEAVLVARASGTVTRIDKRLGDAVAAGQAVAYVDSLDAASIASDRSIAATRAAQARAVLARETRLFDQGVTPRQDFEAAKAAADVAEAELRRANAVASAAHVAPNGRSVAIVAPIAGRITAQTAMLGGYVTPDSQLFRIADARAVQVEAAVPAADARKVEPGDTVTLNTGSAMVSGTVRSVTPTANTATGAATVVITPSAGSTALIPGAGVQVIVHSSGGGATGAVIPEEAVQVIDGKDSVFVKTAKGFKVQPVVVAFRTGGRAEISSGLASGQRIATRNAFLLKAELTKSVED